LYQVIQKAINNHTKNLNIMTTVTITMIDEFTGETVIRTIDANNAYKSGTYCYELGNNESQKKQLNNWIIERANKQHNTILNLISWKFD